MYRLSWRISTLERKVEDGSSRLITGESSVPLRNFWSMATIGSQLGPSGFSEVFRHKPRRRGSRS